MSEELANRRELVALLRREARWSGVWFADSLVKAAGLIEDLSAPAPIDPNTDEPRSRLLTAATRMLEVRGDQEDPGVRVSARDLIEVLSASEQIGTDLHADRTKT